VPPVPVVGTVSETLDSSGGSTGLTNMHGRKEPVPLSVILVLCGSSNSEKRIVILLTYELPLSLRHLASHTFHAQGRKLLDD
jgi:hypothetical protein